MSEKDYEVCDPLRPAVWTPVIGVWNAWAAVREVLKTYDPATLVVGSFGVEWASLPTEVTGERRQ